LHIEPVVQLAWGLLPASAAAHSPAVPPGACSDAEQAWHAGQDALPQHTPSTHELPLAHSGHPCARQSPPAPAATLHADPCVLWGWQVPPLPQ
jgi:hypothetical protein